MTTEEQVAGIVEKNLSTDLFLVDVIIKGKNIGKKVIVLVDGDKGVSIDQCAKISRSISDEFEQTELIDGAYKLEVSSPGLDYPIKMKRQFVKNVGRNLDVEKADESRLQGKLIDVGDSIVLEVSEKKQVTKVEIPIENIKKANVLVSFK